MGRGGWNIFARFVQDRTGAILKFFASPIAAMGAGIMRANGVNWEPFQLGILAQHIDFVMRLLRLVGKKA
jgi:hypothetical protein